MDRLYYIKPSTYKVGLGSEVKKLLRSCADFVFSAGMVTKDWNILELGANFYFDSNSHFLFFHAHFFTYVW